MCVFFRVLTPGCNGTPGTADKWRQQFTGSHLAPPGEWIEKWKSRSTKLDDYPLLCADGCRYTPKARETFLRFADVKYDELTPEQKFFIGEYEGVAAYDNAEEALRYGGEGPIGNLKLYVVFEGVKLGSLPESADGGFRVKFIKEIIPPMDRNALICWLTRQTV